MGTFGHKRSKGFDVNKVKAINPMAIMPITAKTREINSSSIPLENRATAAVHAVKEKTHNNNEPS